MKMAREPLLTDIEVIKVWKDTGNADLRPTSIEADLFCDGTLYQTVELTAANNWHYVFHDLGARAQMDGCRSTPSRTATRRATPRRTARSSSPTR